MKGMCRLCGKESVLEESHIVPKLVYTWLKTSSGTGFLRSGLNPNQRVQDGHKLFLLCGTCEDVFSRWETQFANHIFHPFNKGEMHSTPYDAWLLKFCVSVSWRVLHFFIEQESLVHFPEHMQAKAKKAMKIWQEFLLDARPHPGRCEQHFLPLDSVVSFTQSDMPTNINRYIARSVDIDAAWAGDDAFVYAKLGRFLIVGFMHIQHPKEWQGTKIHVRDGIIEPRTYTLPRAFGDFFLDKARRAAGVQAKISDQQQKKIEVSFRKDLDRAAHSESLKALDQDVRLFGKNTVWPLQ
jgi:hypothetical protein